MDGTLYLGDRLFPFTSDFLKTVKDIGGRYVFVTNNSSKGTDAFVEKMKRLGIFATEDDFLTSTDATVALIRQKYKDILFYVMGTSTFIETLKKEGIPVTEDLDDYSKIGGVLISNDTELTFRKLSDISLLLSDKEKDTVYLATNPDFVCPTEFGYVPDCGSFAEMLRKATGRTPYFIGKPNPDMLLSAMEKFGYEKDACLVIGDRLYTDISAGVNAGMDTAFVLSGEGTKEDLLTYDVKPTAVYKHVGELAVFLRNANKM